MESILWKFYLLRLMIKMLKSFKTLGKDKFKVGCVAGRKGENEGGGMERVQGVGWGKQSFP